MSGSDARQQAASRAYIAHHYGLFVVQTTLCFVLLAESLSSDWHLPELRLYNTLLGTGLALLVAYLAHRAHLRWATPAPRMVAAPQGD